MMNKRDCLFFVADKNMQAMFQGFLGRTAYHVAIGCRPFQFDHRYDIKVASGNNDCGLYTRASALLQPFFCTHQRVVVVADAKWEGSPGAAEIERKLETHVRDAGWSDNSGCAVVIDPELENWVWQDNPHVFEALGCSGGRTEEVKALLDRKGWWPRGQAKPAQPKKAVEFLLSRNRLPRSSSIYRVLASKVAISGCQDAAFDKLRSALRSWFPLPVDSI